MKFYGSIVLSAALVASVAAADTTSYSVTRSVTVDATAGEVWQVIGDFCDIDDWHPAFIGCALKAPEGGGVHRVLTMDGGAEFLEKLVASEPGLSHTYSIVEAPVPITNYVSTLAITPGDKVEVTWSSRFKTDDPEIEALVISVYESGLAALAERLSD